jgi:PhzF family phenazine biosynthesis protein
MDERRALLVDAFTADPLAGNVAGVVPDASGLAEEQMRSLARELGAPETAFVLPSGSADRRVRYFTPETEVDLCGHATVASHAHLYADGIIEAGDSSLETAAGEIEVTVEPDGTVWMTQTQPSVERVDVPYDRLAGALGVDPAVLEDVGADLPAAVASTGLPWLVVPVNFLEALGSADPDPAAVESIADDHGAVGIYAFTFDALSADSTLHARAFAPGAGVPEDPVTGTASGACGAYLRHVGAFDSTPDEMVFEQGHYVDRPGQVRVRVGTSIRVGGQAAVALDGTVRVPPHEGDDIIEA